MDAQEREHSPRPIQAISDHHFNCEHSARCLSCRRREGMVHEIASRSNEEARAIYELAGGPAGLSDKSAMVAIRALAFSISAKSGELADETLSPAEAERAVDQEVVKALTESGSLERPRRARRAAPQIRGPVALRD
jgi:hypothetical protein